MDAGREKKLIISALVAAFVFLINFGPKFIYTNTTRSLPLGLYIAIPGMNLRPGDIVVYDPPEEVRQLVKDRGYGTGNESFLKHVGALPGDSFAVIDDTILVNGTKVGDIKRMDTQGNPMPVMDGFHFVEEGEFLPIGDKINSLDGRYMGTVPIKNIKTRVVPLVTEW